MNAADNTGAETIQPEQDNNNSNVTVEANPPNLTAQISEEDIEQATLLAFLLTSIDEEDDIEDTIAALRKRGIGPSKLNARYEEAQEQMSEMTDADFRRLWGTSSRPTSQPVRRKAVRTAVKKA